MTSCVFLLAALCGALLSSQAQTLPAPDRLALGEIVQLAATHPSPKTLVEEAQGHPVALVHGRASVGFIGRLLDDVSEGAWRTWAADQLAVEAGACRSGIASFRIDAYSEITSKAYASIWKEAMPDRHAPASTAGWSAAQVRQAPSETSSLKRPMNPTEARP